MAIEHASKALIVVGPSYHKGGWTAHEYEEIKRQGIPKIEVADDELRSLVSKNDMEKLFSCCAGKP
jgi:hypothetical protein